MSSPTQAAPAAPSITGWITAKSGSIYQQFDAVPEDIRKQLKKENGFNIDIADRNYYVKQTETGFLVWNNPVKPKKSSASGGFKKEWRPLVFAFHLPSGPSVAENKKMIEAFRKDNPHCYLSRYEVKEDGKGYYVFEEKAPIGSG